MGPEGILKLNWNSEQLSFVKPGDFQTYYPPQIENPALADAIRRIGGGCIARASGYGSAFSGDATKNSLRDILVIVRNPWGFYEAAAASGNIKLGTIKSAGFHSLWSYKKGNFHLGDLTYDDKTEGIKLWVMSNEELPKHARGGLPETTDSKGGLYLAGRMQKAMFPTILDEATVEENKEIDLAFNQARIDGVWLALGLTPRVFGFEHFAGIYINLSYMSDRRIEKANKSQSLLNKNYAAYEQMLNPILACFIDQGIIRQIEEDAFAKVMSLGTEDVKDWLKQCSSHASNVNFFQNIWTMGPLNGLGYGIAKVRRAKGF